jgi:hypothetical protein
MELKNSSLEEFSQAVERDERVRLISDPALQKLNPELRRGVGELRYFSRMNRPSKAFFWRSRYGICDQLLNEAPVLTPGDYSVEQALVIMKMAQDVGELKVTEGTTRAEKDHVRRITGISKVPAVLKRSIKLKAKGAWTVAIPSRECEKTGVENWKPEIDSELVYAPKYGHTHLTVRGFDARIEKHLLADAIGLDAVASSLDMEIYRRLGLDSRVALESVPIQNIINMPAPENKTAFVNLFSKPEKKQKKTGWAVSSCRRKHTSFLTDYYDNRSLFYEHMCRLSIALHIFAEELDYRTSQLSFQVSHRLDQYERVFRIFNWKTFSDMFACPQLPPHLLRLIASFHPYYLGTHLLVRNERARYYFTRDELCDLCSAIDVSESVARPDRPARAIKSHRFYDRTQNRIIYLPDPRELASELGASKEPKRGYFIGDAAPSYVDPKLSPDQFAYATWLRANMPAALMTLRSVVQTRLTKEEESARKDAAYIEDKLFSDTCAMYEGQIDNTSTARRKFKEWLYDRSQIKPIGDGMEVVTVADWLTCDRRTQEDLTYSFMSYCSNEQMDSRLDGFLAALEKAKQ